MNHNTNHHILIKSLSDKPEIPIGFEVAWNSYENGYTGKVKYWFSKSEVEENEHWTKASDLFNTRCECNCLPR